MLGSLLLIPVEYCLGHDTDMLVVMSVAKRPH